MNWSIVMNVLFVVLIIAAIVLGVLYYFGRKLEIENWMTKQELV